MSQISQENACLSLFNKAAGPVLQLYQKETPTEPFSCEMFEIFEGHLWATPFVYETQNGYDDNPPSKICLGEDVLKMSWRRLEDVFSVAFFFVFQEVFKTSSRHLENITARGLLEYVLNTSWTRLEQVWNTSCKDVLKNS